MAAISRYMELTIEPVQQVSGRSPEGWEVAMEGFPEEVIL